jgi:hypothetical protein
MHGRIVSGYEQPVCVNKNGVNAAGVSTAALVLFVYGYLLFVDSSLNDETNRNILAGNKGT